MKIKNLLVCSLLSISFFSFAQEITETSEICNNAIDDDGDGKIDLNDDDCTCNTIEVNSIIPNPSFEEYERCPFDTSQLNFSMFWKQATEATTDYFNSCGFMPKTFVTKGLAAGADGNAFVGGWYMTDSKEYLGSNLLEPLEANESYQLTLRIAGMRLNSDREIINKGFYKLPSTELVLYGKRDTVAFPEYKSSDCPLRPDTGWMELSSIPINPDGDWEEVSFNFSYPEDIKSIMIGPPCDLPADYPNKNQFVFVARTIGVPMLFYDKLILNKANKFSLNISVQGVLAENAYEEFCNKGKITLQAEVNIPDFINYQYQWYKDGIAIIGATNSTYELTDKDATYTVKAYTSLACYTGTFSLPEKSFLPKYTYEEPTCTYPYGRIFITTANVKEVSFDGGITYQSATTYIVPNSTVLKIKIRTIGGCESNIQNLTPQQYVILAPTATVSPPLDCQSKGKIVFTNIAAEYSINAGETWSENPEFEVTAGTYTLISRDKNGCTSSSIIETIDVLAWDETITYQIIPPTCDEKSSILFLNTVAFYSIDNGKNWQTSPQFNNLDAGEYHLVIKNNFNCISNNPTTVSIIDYTVKKITINAVNPQCENNGQISIQLEEIEETSTVKYSINNGVTWQDSPIFDNLGGGTYTAIAEIDGKCKSSAETITFTSNNLVIEAAQNCSNNLKVNVSGGMPPYQYSIDNINYQDSPLFLTVPEGYYSLYVRDAIGCVAQSDEIIYTVKSKLVQFFSPNGDGVNDIWDLSYLNTCPTAKVHIFDRFGRPIIELNKNNWIWDGTLKGKNLPSDTYWFAIDFGDGNTSIYKSYIVLKR